MCKSIQSVLVEFNKQNIQIKEADIGPFYFMLCEKFSRYVIGETLSEYISDDYDPPWDCSGHLITEDMGEKELLSYLCKKYYSLGDWAENTYTGVTIATGVSGCGLNHETYEDEIVQTIEEFIYHRIEDFLGPDWESDELDILSIDLASAIIDKMDTISLESAWDLTEKITREKIEQEHERRKKEQDIHENRVIISNDITRRYFSDFIKLRIEYPNKKSLLDTIRKIFPCLTVNELEAIEHEGLKLNLSNKVSWIVRDKSCVELDRRKKELS